MRTLAFGNFKDSTGIRYNYFYQIRKRSTVNLLVPRDDNLSLSLAYRQGLDLYLQFFDMLGIETFRALHAWMGLLIYNLLLAAEIYLYIHIMALIKTKRPQFV